jgi:hypothetical protein
VYPYARTRSRFSLEILPISSFAATACHRVHGAFPSFKAREKRLAGENPAESLHTRSRVGSSQPQNRRCSRSESRPWPDSSICLARARKSDLRKKGSAWRRSSFALFPISSSSAFWASISKYAHFFRTNRTIRGLQRSNSFLAFQDTSDRKDHA